MTQPHSKDDVLRMADILEGKTNFVLIWTGAPVSKQIAVMLRAYAEVVDGWRPIETAPKDGRGMILLLTPSRFPQVAFSNTWWTCGFSVECKPTHWMPIAELPEPTDALSTRGR